MRAFLTTIAMFGLMAACGDGATAPTPELEWEATVVGVDGWEQLLGEATAVAFAGAPQFATTMVLVGDEPGAVRPWHVHHNTCTEGGGIVGADGDYPRLQVDAAGQAQVTTTVPAGLDPAANYHVNVHLSEAEMQVIIACGDLNPVIHPAG